MASLTEVLAAGNAPPTQGISGDIQEGMKAGIGLATAAEQIEGAKVKLEDDKANLVMKQASTANSLLTNLARANPAVAKMMVKQVREKLLNLGVDPEIANYTISDDVNRQRQVAFSQYAGGSLIQDKEMAAQYFQELGSVVGYDKAAQMYDQELKNQQDDAKQSRAQASAERIAATKAAAAVDKAKLSPSQERNQRIEFARIADNQKLKPLIQNHQQATKDLTLLNEAINDPEGIPVQVLKELGAGMGTLISNARSTGAERDAQVFENLNTKVASLLTKASTSGVEKVKDPEIFKEIKTQFERLVKANKTNAQGQLKALKRTSKDDYINKTQDEAIKNVEDQLGITQPAPQGSNPDIEAKVQAALKINPKADPNILRQKFSKM